MVAVPVGLDQQVPAAGRGAWNRNLHITPGIRAVGRQRGGVVIVEVGGGLCVVGAECLVVGEIEGVVPVTGQGGGAGVLDRVRNVDVLAADADVVSIGGRDNQIRPPEVNVQGVNVVGSGSFSLVLSAVGDEQQMHAA